MNRVWVRDEIVTLKPRVTLPVNHTKYRRIGIALDMFDSPLIPKHVATSHDPDNVWIQIEHIPNHGHITDPTQTQTGQIVDVLNIIRTQTDHPDLVAAKQMIAESAVKAHKHHPEIPASTINRYLELADQHWITHNDLRHPNILDTGTGIAVIDWEWVTAGHWYNDMAVLMYCAHETNDPNETRSLLKTVKQYLGQHIPDWEDLHVFHTAVYMQKTTRPWNKNNRKLHDRLAELIAVTDPETWYINLFD